jgi:glutathionyl-hydroquinone reductase
MRRSSATGGASSHYPNLLRDLYQVSGIAETVHMDHKNNR